ncbi:MAG: hypothetical protein LUD51_05680 [Clostridia bacterium]|nr:hypothetical protein [Clostridia bacterium]
MAASDDMYKVKEFLNDENREGLKKFLDKYLNTGDEDYGEFIDEIIQILTDEANGSVMVSELHRRIKAFMADEENDLLYGAVMSGLAHADLFTFESWDDEGVTYPLMESEELPGRTIFPVFTRKAITHDPELAAYDVQEDVFYDIQDWMRDAGADCFVLNPGTHGCVLDLDDACSYYAWEDGLSEKVIDTLYSGISKDDLCPITKALFTYSAVECFLEDGTYLKGLFDKPEDLNAEGFVLIPVDDSGDPTDEGEEQFVRYGDIKIIRYMEEDPADNEEDADGADEEE